MGRTLIALLALGLAPAPASACFNEMEIELRQEAVKTARAERLMRSGHLRRAFRVAGRTLRDLERNTDASPGRALHLGNRLRRVVAVSAVRLHGAVDRRRWRTPGHVSADARREHLDWAVATLERLARSDDPIDQARYAEALDQVGRHQEAVTILTRLAEDDVMPDAYGYAALSRSQDALGRTALRDRARRACEAMTRREQRGICPSFPAS
ncbi:MAG: hypothetical protein SangKO_018620 [Sandaracinaceae bacterium]|nr:MAG: hypothetical protein EVA89_19910 [Sandaracinaceae bacterium]HBQ14961.1 hypothetical protein [Myxococcales bacterium]